MVRVQGNRRRSADCCALIVDDLEQYTELVKKNGGRFHRELKGGGGVDFERKFLDPNGIGRRELIHLQEELPDIGVRGRIDIDRKRGNRGAALGLDEWVLDDPRVLVAGKAGAGALGDLRASEAAHAIREALTPDPLR